MDTSRISSGFDIEFQLGSKWFLTALNLLNDNGLLGPPGIPIIISAVQITFDPGWDLEITIAGFAIPVFARAELSAGGDELILTTNIPQIPPRTIPFGVLKNLAAPPVLVKLAGDADHENVIALLANLDIHAEPQSDEPLPPGEFLERGNADDAQSFLPMGKDSAFGMGKDTFPRFANNIWHTNLRAEDGSHPLPDEENKKGTWSKVSMKPKNGKIVITLEGDIPLDSPIIDLIPDPHVKITLTIKPVVNNSVLSFTIDTDTDVDMGLLGDLFGGITGGVAGGIIGFIVGLITGGILSAVLIGAGIGFVAGVIIIEVAEVIAEGIVNNEIKAKINGKTLPDINCCETGIVQIAKPDSEGGFNLSVLDSIPASIPVHTANPDNELLYKISYLVTSEYDELAVNSKGFAAAGASGTDEKFQPEKVTVKSFNYDSNNEKLVSVTYKRSDSQEQTISAEEVFDRAAQGELTPPFKIFEKPEKSTLRIPEGKLACVCLKPTAINQEKTIVKQIEFENGLRIKTEDAIALQDAGAIVVIGYQLIHPKDYNAYFRAKADFFKDNNFESLPKF